MIRQMTLLATIVSVLTIAVLAHGNQDGQSKTSSKEAAATASPNPAPGQTSGPPATQGATQGLTRDLKEGTTASPNPGSNPGPVQSQTAAPAAEGEGVRNPTPEQENKILRIQNRFNALNARYAADVAQAQSLEKDAEDAKAEIQKVQPELAAAVNEFKASLGAPPKGKQWQVRFKEDGGIEAALASIGNR